VIGVVGGEVLQVAGRLSLPVTELREAWEGAIPQAFLAQAH
jgi:hypothetical protein